MESVKIGDKYWATTNLDVENFQNGDEIPFVKSKTFLLKAGNLKEPAFSYFNFNTSNKEKYSKLYNWYALNDLRGIVPEGWRLPTFEDWVDLIEHLGVDSGTKLKSRIGWSNFNNLEIGSVVSGNGNDEVFFNCIPSGFNSTVGSLYGDNNMGKLACFWCTKEVSDSFAWNFSIHYSLNIVSKSIIGKADGASIRCIKC
jgi:uncharacterized protein (TIGR02145 family)